MRAQELLREGKPDEALAELKSAVQKDPSNAKLRVFLFQLLSIDAKWESALAQLEISGDLDPGNLAMVQAYRETIRCEGHRARVFRGEISPLVLGEPDRWVALLIEAFKLSANGQHAEASRFRKEAFEFAPPTSGELTAGDQSTCTFEWIADADPRLGPVLEAMLNGQYYWIPMHRISQIDVEAPADLRDFVWTPVHFTFATGAQSVGMIPTRYFGSEAEVDPNIRLARKTDWIAESCDANEDDSYRGIGQRMLATDANDFALLEIRKISLNVDVEDSESLASECVNPVVIA